MSDLNTLPVAPEFTEVLTESAINALVEYLSSTNAPESVIKLARNIEALGYYQTECYRAPERVTCDRKDRLDIETIVIETINEIAVCGGIFHGPNGNSQPRETPAPVKVRK